MSCLLDDNNYMELIKYPGGDVPTFVPSSRPQISPDNWYHFVIAVNDSGSWTIFVNGIKPEMDDYIHDIIASDTDINLGIGCASGYAQSNMYYDDFRIYNRVLGQDDVDALYALRHPF